MIITGLFSLREISNYIVVHVNDLSKSYDENLFNTELRVNIFYRDCFCGSVERVGNKQSITITNI